MACGGFFLACEDFWENLRPFIPRLRFFFFFFLKWRLIRAHLFHSFCQDKSKVAQRAETTVAECSLTSWLAAALVIVCEFWLAAALVVGRARNSLLIKLSSVTLWPLFFLSFFLTSTPNFPRDHFHSRQQSMQNWYNQMLTVDWVQARGTVRWCVCE